MVKTKIKPIKVVRVKITKLDPNYYKALHEASDCLEVDDSRTVRIETYKTDDLRWMLEEVWKWSATIQQIQDGPGPDKWTPEAIQGAKQDDIARVRKIMRLIPKEGRWPYVSYWAHTMKELLEVDTTETGEIFTNHGAGWHRIIAAIELGLPTVDILFY